MDFTDLQHPSILVAISQREVTPWKEIRHDGQEMTWVSRFRKSGISVVYYLSEEPSCLQNWLNEVREFNRFRLYLGPLQGKLDKALVSIRGFREPEFVFIKELNELRVSGPSTYFGMHNRNFGLFKWFIEHRKEEFLFRTNVSSYLNLRALGNYMEPILKKREFLGGEIMNTSDIRLVSGSGLLMPRSTVEKILSNWNYLERHIIEDVAISRLCARIGIKAIRMPRIDYGNLEQLKNSKVYANRNNFHFRCKGILRPGDDVEIMKKLDLQLNS